MRRNWRKVLMGAVLGTTLFSSSCGDMLVRSVKYGTYGYISGSVGSGLAGGQITSLINNLLTGGLFFQGTESGTGT